ncbi:MAG: hypothetical protein HY717_06655 [Planctomycetes bacterium]|nr:hypothetical protein [Planctomycetota bacterium]
MHERGQFFNLGATRSLVPLGAVVLAWLTAAPGVWAQTTCTCPALNLYGSCRVAAINHKAEEFPGSAAFVRVSTPPGPVKNYLYIADLFIGATYRFDATDISKLPTTPAVKFPSPGGPQSTTGLVFNPHDQRLYWAIGGKLVRTSSDLSDPKYPDSIEEVAEVDMAELANLLRLPKVGVLAGLTYHVSRKAFWGVDIVNDVYFEFDLDGKPTVIAEGLNQTALHFRSPALSPFGGGAYGNSITYVNLEGKEFFDLPVGRLAEGKVTRVERVHAAEGTEGGIFFTFGDATGLYYPLDKTIGKNDFVTGIFYWDAPCGANQGMEVLMDLGTSTGQSKIFLVSADPTESRGLASFNCSITGSVVQLDWLISQGYKTLEISRLDVRANQSKKILMLENGAAGPGSASDKNVSDGLYEYTATLTSLKDEIFPDRACRITVGRGSVISSTSYLSNQHPSDRRPFAITSIGSRDRLVVADLESGNAHVYDLDLNFKGGFPGPFVKGLNFQLGLTTGVAWSSKDNLLLWLFNQDGQHFLQATELLTNGNEIAGFRNIGAAARVRTPFNLTRNPDLAGLAYDAVRDQYWAADRQNGVAYSFAADGSFTGRSATQQIPNPREVNGFTGGGLAVVDSGDNMLVLDWVVGKSADGFAHELARIAYSRSKPAGGAEQIILPGSETLIVDLPSTLLAREPAGLVFVAKEGQPPFEYAVAEDTQRIYKLRMKEGIFGKEFIRGDANADGNINVSDPSFILYYLFKGGAKPPCADAADATDDEMIDISDAIQIFRHLFLGAGPLPEPFSSCGRDFDPDFDPTKDLTCDLATCL